MSNFTVFIFDNNAPLFSLSILQENAFLNNRIVFSVSNRLKCVFLRNKKTASQCNLFWNFETKKEHL